MIWNEKHQRGLEAHIRTANSVPHVTKYTKDSALQWARGQVSKARVCGKADLDLLIGSVAAIFLHHGLSESEAKATALEIGKGFHAGRDFIEKVGVLWETDLAKSEQSRTEPALYSYWAGISQYPFQTI